MKFLKLSIVLMLAIAFIISSCSDSSNNAGGNLKTDIAGNWKVLKTVVTSRGDHLPGYQYLESWTIKVNGNTAELYLNAADGKQYGPAQGRWGKSTFWAQDHWIFEGQFDYYGMTMLTIVEINNVNPIKGINENKVWNAPNQMWELLESLTITQI